MGVSVSSGFLSPDIPLGILASATIKGKPDKKPWLLSETRQQSIGYERHGALLLFLQVFDIGNPLSLSTQQAAGGKTFSRLNWSSLFNPGARIGYGFKNMPIAILAGFTYKVNPGGGRAIMAKVSVNVDVPIWHIWAN
jgi:hypothetical protein